MSRLVGSMGGQGGMAECKSKSDETRSGVREDITNVSTSFAQLSLSEGDVTREDRRSSTDEG